MSRYIAQDKHGREMAFGFDRPLTEYFADIYLRPDELTDDMDSELYDAASSYGICAFNGKHYSNSMIYDWIKERMADYDFTKYKDLLKNILDDLEF